MPGRRLWAQKIRHCCWSRLRMHLGQDMEKFWQTFGDAYLCGRDDFLETCEVLPVSNHSLFFWFNGRIHPSIQLRSSTRSSVAPTTSRQAWQRIRSSPLERFCRSSSTPSVRTTRRMPQPRFLTMTTWWRKRARLGQLKKMQVQCHHFHPFCESQTCHSLAVNWIEGVVTGGTASAGGGGGVLDKMKILHHVHC